MSRSRRKTPITSNVRCRSAKWWRVQENRRYRTYVRDMLSHDKSHLIQGFNGRFGNEWDSPRDGRHWFGEMKKKPCADNEVCHLYGFTIIKDCKTKGHRNCDVYFKQLMRK